MNWFGKKLKNVKSITLQIAVKCGFMTNEQAHAADRFLDDNGNGEHPTLEMLADNGYLTPAQVVEVTTRRLEEHPAEAVKENFKKACRVQKKMEQTGTIALADVLKARGG